VGGAGERAVICFGRGVEEDEEAGGY